MKLSDFLDAGNMVLNSPFDKKLKPLGEMSLAAQRRHGYIDEDEYWTERGFNRATSSDITKLDASSRQLRRLGK